MSKEFECPKCGTISFQVTEEKCLGCGYKPKKSKVERTIVSGLSVRKK